MSEDATRDIFVTGLKNAHAMENQALSIRGSVHAHAYALALVLEKITGVDVKKSCRPLTSRSAISPSVRNILTRAPIVASTPLAPTTTRKCRASGGMAK